MDGDAGLIASLIIFALAIAVYLIPTIVAFSRSHPSRWLIAVINVCFGGTGIGWLGSLVWACHAIHRSPSGSHGGESGLNIGVNDPLKIEIIESLSKSNQEPNVGAVIENLHRLQTLLQSGQITQSEYEKLKGRVI